MQITCPFIWKSQEALVPMRTPTVSHQQPKSRQDTEYETESVSSSRGPSGTQSQTLFLGLMESCGVCFPCGQTSEGETRNVAPDLLPKFETIRLPAWQEVPDMSTLRLEYRA